MPDDDDALPAFAPQWLRSGQTSKPAFGAGAGSAAQAKSETKGPARPGLSPKGDRDLTRKPADRSGSWGPNPSGSNSSRAPNTSSARPSYRAGSADTARDRTTYRDAEEERYTFSSRLVGQTTPKRTNSLDSPVKGTAREWEDKGPRSGGERRTDNGPVRRALDVNRPGQGRGNDRGYGGNAARVAPGRDSWQPLSPELGRSRPETEQSWTSRLADVSPSRVAAANPLLPVLGAAASAPVTQSAPQTPRMADALQQVSRETAASAAADQLRRDQLALKQSKQLIPILAPASKGKPYKSPAAAHSTATAHANGIKTSALLNGGLPRKSSLESLGRMSSQGTKGEEGAVLGNGHGSGPSLVELGMALERPASGVNSGSAQKAAAAAAGQGPQTGTQKSPKSAGASKERERNSFFDSLRRKSRSPSLAPLGEGEDADADVAEAADAETPSGATAAEPASPVTNARAVPDSAAVTPEPAERQQHTPPASLAAVGEPDPAETPPAKPGGQPDVAPKPSSSGSLGERLLIPAEEEAFLRSLGWEGDDMDDDDEEGGLTEEEIAAFQAKAQAAQFTRGVARLNFGKQP
ncbi:g1700 [Coccomyxa viridis]|uniref:G1700 protein n=1 Tax=Coccomyxa viridis TaxID=1274662 RepID=A0ABP1FMG2_9CHLO